MSNLQIINISHKYPTVDANTLLVKLEGWEEKELKFMPTSIWWCEEYRNETNGLLRRYCDSLRQWDCVWRD